MSNKSSDSVVWQLFSRDQNKSILLQIIGLTQKSPISSKSGDVEADFHTFGNRGAKIGFNCVGPKVIYFLIPFLRFDAVLLV